MKKPFFSVVMPSYGVEAYLEKAVESILQQTFENWELLIVEDGSPDRTGALAEELKKRDERIQVLHHETNRGLSSARNTGIEQAAGTYIWFMDPDDHVEEDMLEQVYASIQTNRAELVITGHVEEYYDNQGSLSYTHPVRPKKHLFTEQKELREYVIELEQETLYGYAWNKFYSMDHIRKNGLQYETVKLIEDIVFNIQFCMDIQRMNVLDITPYHYAKRMEGSLTTKFVPDYYPLHRRRISMLYEQQKYWGNNTKQVLSILGSLYGRYLLSAMERNCDRRSGMTGADRRMFCRKVFADTLFQELIPEARARDSRALKLALFCMKRKSVFLCTALGRGVHMVRKSLPMLYSKVKSER